MLKKILLVVFGIILSLAFLEMSMRVLGLCLEKYNEYKNSKTVNGKNKCRIMCIGESMTYQQYTVNLQEILNEKYPEKFSVIDCGIPGMPLNVIFDEIDSDIEKFHPDIAVCMMGMSGVDERYTHKASSVTAVLKRIKIYKLFCEIVRLFNVNKKFKNMNAGEKFKYASELTDKGNLEKAAEIMEELLKNDSDNETYYSELMGLYSNIGYRTKNSEKILKGVNMAKEALKMNYNKYKDKYYDFIFEEDFKSGNIEDLKFYADMAVEKDTEIFSSDRKYILYGYIEKYISDEQKEKIRRFFKLEDSVDFGMHAVELLEQKKYDEADKYFKKTEELRTEDFYSSGADKIYKLIIKKLTDNNIKVICMQYPVRSIDIIKNMLKDEDYFNDIYFLSNEKIFKDIIAEGQYNKVFLDRCNGDFGHCRYPGNKIIAENVAGLIEKIAG